MTPFYDNNPDMQKVISFQKVEFDIQTKKDIKLSIAELEHIDVFDPNKYLKKDLIEMTK